MSLQFSKPNITQAEIDAVVACLVEGHLATGKPAEAFENAFRDKFGYQHVVSVNSGTTALQMALNALGITHGDEVIVTAYSIMATVNCILSVGATPVFCDVDRETYNLEPTLLPALITKNTKAILPASIFGVPCDVPGIREHAPGIPIIEDSIEALGAKRLNRPIGQDVDFATFGFYPNKQITTCQGGILIAADPDHAEIVRRRRFQGYGNQPDLWNQSYGWNVRLPDPLAAMGIVQLGRLEEMQARLREVAGWYDQLLTPTFRKQTCLAGDTPSLFIYGIELPQGVDKRAFTDRMAARGIPTRPYFNAMHRVRHVQPFYRDCPNTDAIGACTIALPLHFEMTQDDVERVSRAFIMEAVR